LNNCRFYPSCSNYCIQSLLKFGLIKGLVFTFFRLIKCHPFGQSGFDPVKKKITFKPITLQIIKNYRKENLYHNLPKKLASYKEDSYLTTKHFGLFCDNKLISGLTLIEDKNENQNNRSIQIRGMFTIKSEYNKGYGSTLINLLIKYLKKRDFQIIWCNARLKAINFYKKNNFYGSGKTFKIKLIGDHQKVIRLIK
tara:strand:+ start:454 stop:1041 length:588 start_codon:yes stop_codon:yes gene_type:complete